MKNSSKILLGFMLVMMICCVSAVSATDINSTDDAIITDDIAIDDVSEIVEEVEIDDASDDVVDEGNLSSMDNSCEDTMLVDFSENTNSSLDNSYVVFVGTNITSDGGNGSYENPYENFNLISASDNSYKDEITINIFEGTYYMTPNLLFNTSN